MKKTGTEVLREVNRLHVVVFEPSILADIGKMLRKIWFKNTKKAVTADTMESLLSKGKFVLNINLHYIYSTCLEKVLATDSSDFPAAHTYGYPPSTVIKKSFEKAQKESRDLNSEDVEELAKQTLLCTEDVEMWVTHLDSVKK